MTCSRLTPSCARRSLRLQRNRQPITRARLAHQPARLAACLLKRVFDIDIEYCPNCGGTLKIIAAIVDPAMIAKILTHLHLPARAPPRSSARRVDLFQAA